MEINKDKDLDNGNSKDDNKEKEVNKFENYLNQLDKFDKNFSKKIHDFTLPKIAEYIVYIFARMFNPDLITSYFIIILSYKSLNNEHYFILKPIISTIVNLVLSLALKKYIGRPRPETSKISSRLFDLRKYEKNCSMPSGDSIQAGNWAILIYIYTGYNIGFFIVPFVMYARIYFYCHYLFDTIIGSLFGIFISLNINISIIYFGY
jgi:membrane-associated phospholipid phosphatase